jgi:hypothetical protein
LEHLQKSFFASLFLMPTVVYCPCLQALAKAKFIIYHVMVKYRVEKALQMYSYDGFHGTFNITVSAITGKRHMGI